MSDVPDDRYLYAVAAAAVSVVLTVDIEKRKRKKRRTWVRPLLRSRSEVGACDLLLPELRATDTRMYANFTRVSPAEFDFLLCAVREQITGSSVAQAYTTAHEAGRYSAVPRHRHV